MGAPITDKLRKMHDSEQTVRPGPGHAGIYIDADTDEVYVNINGSPEPLLRGTPKVLVCDGDSAGPVVCAGIEAGDLLVSVIMFDSGVPSDLTSEFTITANDEIDNTGGTDTTGNKLVVNVISRAG